MQVKKAKKRAGQVEKRNGRCRVAAGKSQPTLFVFPCAGVGCKGQDGPRELKRRKEKSVEALESCRLCSALLRCSLARGAAVT